MTHTPPKIDHASASSLTAWDKSAVDAVLRPLAASAGKTLQAVVKWGGQVGSTRRANIEIRDALGRNVAGNFAVLVWVSETEGGDPGSSQITSAATGTVIFDLDSGFIFIAQTDANGALAIDIEGSAGYRWLSVVPLGGVYGSGATWA